MLVKGNGLASVTVDTTGTVTVSGAAATTFNAQVVFSRRYSCILSKDVVNANIVLGAVTTATNKYRYSRC
ncbi:MAG UNVERIFIED_CONTAM: hypothetical protein LVQ98_07160 [Rickettsiaceae bacterium]|jgi:hypothetical protein